MPLLIVLLIRLLIGGWKNVLEITEKNKGSIRFCAKIELRENGLFGKRSDCCIQTVAFRSGARFPRARPQPLPSLRSVQGLRLVLFPQESAPTLQALERIMYKVSIYQSGHIGEEEKEEFIILSRIGHRVWESVSIQKVNTRSSNQ